MNLIIKWLIYTLAIGISAQLLPGVAVSGFWIALLTALALGLINAILKPLFIILTLPITILTLGLFTLVINALLIMLTDFLVPGFEVKNFWWALLFSIILSVVNFILSKLIRDKKTYHG